MNPIDAVLEDIDAFMEKQSFAVKKPPPFGLSPTQENELELWKRWDTNGRKPEDLRPLVQSLEPLVKNRSKLFENKLRDIPTPFLQQAFENRLLNALETYDPKRGKMSTYVTDQLKQVGRFVKTYQNDVRASERVTDLFGRHNKAKDYLRDLYGREPSTFELAEYLKEPLSRVEAAEKQNIKSFAVGSLQHDPRTITPSRFNETLQLFQYELEPQELSVYEYLHGLNGKPRLTPSQIATKLGVSPSKVTRIKDSITNKWKKYDT